MKLLIGIGQLETGLRYTRLTIPQFICHWLPDWSLPGRKEHPKLDLIMFILTQLLISGWAPSLICTMVLLISTENRMNFFPGLCLQTLCSYSFRQFCKIKAFCFIQSCFCMQRFLIPPSKFTSFPKDNFKIICIRVKLFISIFLALNCLFVLWWHLLAFKD
jgi:hypothetical protein